MVELNSRGKPKGKPGRPTSVEIYPGKYFGHLCILRKVNTKQGVRYDARCDALSKGQGTIKCGKIIRTRLSYLTRNPNPTTHCGCLTYLNANPYPREKGIWWMLFKRCYDPTHVSYKYYGALGVTVCDRWHGNPQGWLNFINDVGGAPSKQHTLDRIDPRKNYSPDNVRWATAEEQAANKREHWIGKPL